MDESMEETWEDEKPTNTINFKPSFVLIAIDTHPSMFTTRKTDDDVETHPFKDALLACYEIADSLILSTSHSNYNQFGVVLADDDQKASFIEVQNNLLESVRLLKQKSSLTNKELKAEYERQGDLDLGSFFLLCKKKFKAIASAYYKRTIIFITNDDDPVKGDAQKRFTALNEAKTFEASEISFELVSMEKNFDYTKFYNELFHLYNKPPTTEEVCQDKDGLVETLQSYIVFRYTKLRSNFYPFKDDPTKYLKVMKVSFIRTPRLHNTDKASRDGRILKRMKPNLGVTPEIKSDYELQCGESTLKFDLKDKYDIYGNDMPLGFHLQYVSDRQSELGIVLDAPTVLIVDPKEDLPYFEQFWQYCAEENKVLVCIKKFRHPTEIRYVELIPKYANKQKLFLIKDLPFSHEKIIPKIVETTELPERETTEKQSALIQQLIETLDFEYDPKMFVDPCHGKKKAYVKAKLLDEPEEEVEDPTGDTEGIDRQIREIVGKIKHEFNLAEPQGSKRKGGSAGTSGRGRKAAK